MALTTYQIQQAYVTFFSRPADAAGLQYWATYEGSVNDLYATFAQSTEYTAIFNGLTSGQSVEVLYQNLFGHSADVAGLNYWTLQLDTGAVTIANLALALNAGSQGTDSVTLANRTTAATDFTAQLDTTAEVLGYSGTDANVAAKSWLSGVTDDASLAAAIAPAALTASVASVVAIGEAANAETGQTFTLTTAADNVVGTTGNDIINGFIDATALAPQTLTAADVIKGGGGTDILNVTVSGTASALPAASISEVETINVRAAAALNSSDLSTIPGLTSFNSDRSVAAITTINMAKGGNYGVIGDGAAQSTATLAFGYAAAADVSTLNISGGVKGTTSTNGPAITMTGTGITSSVINVTGTAANVTGAITNAATSTSTTINAAANLTGTLVTTADTKLTATGTGVIDLDAAALNNAIVTVDASAMTAGGLRVAAGSSTAFKFTGGAGDDYVSTGAILATGLVDAGAGTADRLIVGTANHIDATTGKFYKNFEQLQVNGVAVDADQLASTNTLTGVILNGNSSSITNISSTAAEHVTVASGATGATIGVKGATTAGQIDTVKASLTTTTSAGAAQAIDLTGLTLTGIEKLELTGNGTADATTGAVTFTTTNATSIDSIKFANADNGNTITIAAGQATNLVVDASASTGGVTVDATANNATTGVSIKGGSSYDVAKGAVGLSDIITGGDGNDVLATGLATVTAGTASAIGSATAATAATASDTFTGGAGRDMFVLGTNSAVATASSITDLDLGGSTAALGVDGITLDLATAGAATIVALTDTQKANISAAATLAAAFDAAAAVDTTVNAVVQFTYGTDSYLFVNGVALGSTYSDTNDVAIKITGVTGTLDASDITIV